MNQYNNLTPFLSLTKNASFGQINNLAGIPLNNGVTSQINNLYAVGYNVQNISLATPPGYIAVPNDNSNSVVVNIGGSNKLQTMIGFINSLSLTNPIATDGLQKGEAAIFSNNWGLTAKNDKLSAYKFDNSAYRATFNSGEWLGYFMLNRINEIMNMITEINNNYTVLLNIFNTHIHGGVQAGTDTSTIAIPQLTQTNLPIPATLNNDTNYINNQNYLLNNNATVQP